MEFENETVGEFIGRLKSELVPRGELPVVRLHLGAANLGSNQFVDYGLVKDAIRELETLMLTRRHLCEGPTALEQLGIMVLRDSAGG